MMKSIIRDDGTKKIKLEDFYYNIMKGKNSPEFYRNTRILLCHEDKEEYLILETLGRGRMGFVFLAYHQRKLTALKISYESQENDDLFYTLKKTIGDGFQKYFLTRVGKTAEIKTFFLGGISRNDIYFFDSNAYVSSWEMADSTLSEKLEEHFETKLKWFHQFLKGIEAIHSRNRAHFDIKLDNLFIVGNQLKIGDFEFYLKIDDFKQSDICICGTPGHIAPEIFYDRENITHKVDVFSAGIAFLKLFTGKRFQNGKDLTPNEKQEMVELFKNKNAEKFFNDKDFQLNFKIYWFFKIQLDNSLNNGQLPANEKMIFLLLRRMINIDPSKRPAVNEILWEIENTSAITVNAIKGQNKTPKPTAPNQNPPFSQEPAPQNKRPPFTQTLLKIICISTWSIILSLIIFGIISNTSPNAYSIYSTIVKYIFCCLWGATIISLCLLIYCQEKYWNSQPVRIPASLPPGLAIVPLVFLYLLIVIESYLLIEILAYMWIIIAVLTLVAIYEKIVEKHTIEDKIIKTHFGSITALSITIFILYILWLSGPFRKPFIKSAEFIDTHIFAKVAADVGDNYDEVLEEEFSVSNIHEGSPELFANKLGNYTRRLNDGNLKKELLPGKKIAENKTVNTIIIDNAREYLENKSISVTGKQKVMEKQLDYLICVTQKGHIDEININDRKHPINIIFIGRLKDLIENQNLEPRNWICFLCCINKYTTISVSVLGIDLKDEECEPCLENQDQKVFY